MLITLPRLQAEEHAIALDRGVLGNSMSFKLDAAQEMRRAALDAASWRTLRSRRPRKAGPADLAGMGIGTVSAPSQKAESDG